MLTFGVQIEPQFGYSYEEILQVGEDCESLGFTSLTISDHFMLRGDTVDVAAMECWSLLAALAVDLQKVRIGPLVSCNSYRHPSLLAKIGATVDVFSKGRLDFAIGAGWKKLEYDAYGYDFPPLSERVERMAEAIEVIKALWTEEKASYEGKYYSIMEAICNPKPHQRPRPRIRVGGSSTGTLRVAANLADSVDISFMGPQSFRTRLEKLREFCDAAGRDFSELHKSHFMWALLGREEDIDRMTQDFAGTLRVPVKRVRRIGVTGYLGPPQGFVERLEQYSDAGAQHVILGFAKGWERVSMELFHDEVLQDFR